MEAVGITLWKLEYSGQLQDVWICTLALIAGLPNKNRKSSLPLCAKTKSLVHILLYTFSSSLAYSVGVPAPRPLELLEPPIWPHLTGELE